MPTDRGAFRFEMACEAIAPDGTRTRICTFPVPSVCLTCGNSPIEDDYATATAHVDGSTVVTINNQIGLLCAPCTGAHRRRARGVAR